MTRPSRPFGILAVAYLAVVAVITLGPTLWRTRTGLDDYDVLSLTTWLDGDTWVRLSSPEFVANVLLFVPLGLLLRLAVPRGTWLLAGALGTATSVVIEVLQVATPRVSDPRDIVANAIGALVGAFLGAMIGALSSARGRARGGAPVSGQIDAMAGRPLTRSGARPSGE